MEPTEKPSFSTHNLDSQGIVGAGQFDGGYYADPEDECQAFHICTFDGTGDLAKYSFLWPNGTLFNQNYFICDWWCNFDGSTAEDLYFLTDEIDAEREALASDALGGYGAPAHYAAASAAAGDYSVGDDAQASGSSEIFQQFTSELEMPSQPTT